jgi:hypothetical protein
VPPSPIAKQKYEAIQKWFVEQGGQITRRRFSDGEHIFLLLPEGEAAEFVLANDEAAAFEEGFVRAVEDIMSGFAKSGA